jgi:UDP-N-acetylmuramate dehydrogenase
MTTTQKQTSALHAFDTTVALKKLNTLAVPASAEYYCKINSVLQLQKLCQQPHLPTPQWILGGGSNTVFIQDDIPGLIWHVAIKGIHKLAEGAKHVDVGVAAGENWHEWVQYCISRNWYGLENLIGIPGLVGAAPIQNIGAYGVEVSDSLLWVEAIELATGDKKRFDCQSCHFSYRHSIFKTHNMRHRWLITQVAFRLHKEPCYTLHYPGIQTAIQGETPTLATIAATILQLRKAKLPAPKKTPNAGSFFKNPLVTKEKALALKKEFPTVAIHTLNNQYKISAAWLIEQAGLKGKLVNGIGSAKQHALVLINEQQRPGKEIVAYAEYIRQQVVQKFGIPLDYEAQCIPLIKD